VHKASRLAGWRVGWVWGFGWLVKTFGFDIYTCIYICIHMYIYIYIYYIYMYIQQHTTTCWNIQTMYKHIQTRTWTNVNLCIIRCSSRRWLPSNIRSRQYMIWTYVSYWCYYVFADGCFMVVILLWDVVVRCFNGVSMVFVRCCMVCVWCWYDCCMVCVRLLYALWTMHTV